MFSQVFNLDSSLFLVIRRTKIQLNIAETKYIIAIYDGAKAELPQPHHSGVEFSDMVCLFDTQKVM